MALPNCKSSRQDLSGPPGIQHNKFCCFFSTAAQLITPGATHIAFRSAELLSTCPGGNALIISYRLADTRHMTPSWRRETPCHFISRSHLLSNTSGRSLRFTCRCVHLINSFASNVAVKNRQSFKLMVPCVVIHC